MVLTQTQNLHRTQRLTTTRCSSITRSPTRPPGLHTKRRSHEFQYWNQIVEAASHFFLLQLSLWNNHVKILPWPIIISASSLSLHISQAAPLTVWSCWRYLPRQILSVFNSYLFSRLSWPLPTTYLVIITINSMLLLGILVGSLYRWQLTGTFFFFSDQCSSVSSPAGRPTPRKKLKNKSITAPWKIISMTLRHPLMMTEEIELPKSAKLHHHTWWALIAIRVDARNNFPQLQPRNLHVPCKQEKTVVDSAAATCCISKAFSFTMIFSPGILSSAAVANC